MSNEYAPSDQGPTTTASSFSAEIARLSDTITACERLCLLSARTVSECAVPIVGRADGAESYIPSISRSIPISREGQLHPTTSAQCIAALQQVLPVIGRFRLGVHESRGPAFYTIDRKRLKEFAPDTLETAIRTKLFKGILGLHEQRAPSPDQLRSETAKRQTQDILSSMSFERSHPFTAACLLRATAATDALYGLAWWRSLFVVLWFLNRRGSSRRGFPNVQTTNSPGTAFLTAKCVDAIQLVLRVFDRRRLQFKSLVELMQQLTELDELRTWVEQRGSGTPPVLDQDIFNAHLDYKIRCLARQAEWCVTALKTDGTLRDTYETWRTTATKTSEDGVTDCCQWLLESLRATLNDGAAKAEHALLKAVAQEAKRDALHVFKIVERIHRVISIRLGIATKCTPCPDEAFDLRPLRPDLPDWLCSDSYWIHTQKAVSDTSPIEPHHQSRTLLEALETHWRRHRDAAQDALDTTKLFADYLTSIIDAFAAVKATLDSQRHGPERTRQVLDAFLKATKNVSLLQEHLQKDIEIGAKWASILMNRHLRYATSGSSAEFDPGELAQSLRIILHASDRKILLSTVMTSLNAICSAQQPDGSWACHQPFFWNKGGYAAGTLSVETASALVAIVNTIQQNPERYGASLEETSLKLQPAYRALDRFFAWLSGNMTSFTPPAPLPETPPSTTSPNWQDRPMPYYGWCSDRVLEDGRIHSWATAASIEFLVEFRRLAQERINLLLRNEFLSYHPDELKTLSDVDPTDLATLNEINDPSVIAPVFSDKAPAILQLLTLLEGHKQLEFKEGPWLRDVPPESKINFYSALFYGPPGTSKTFLAKSIAGELGWPLLSLGPSDFFVKGADNLEARSSNIFNALQSGSRMVYFFDEIDELIRERTQTDGMQRSAFSFLTPSFLAKLQDLRDAAKENEFIFILATNYYDHIDTAARRSGRIDREFLIVYPDIESRAALFFKNATDLSTKHIKDRRAKGETAIPTAMEVTKNLLERWEKEYSVLAASRRPAQQQTSSTSQGQGPGASKKADKSDRTPYYFTDLCATFTGSLSHQKIKQLLTRLPGPEASSEASNGAELAPFTKALRDVAEDLLHFNNGDSHHFKPEIKLEAYCDRPEAITEIEAIAKIYPRHAFPALQNLPSPSPKILLSKHLEDLMNSTNKPDFKTKLSNTRDALVKKKL